MAALLEHKKPRETTLTFILSLNRYSFMRRNARRLHREANPEVPVFRTKKREKEIEYSSNGRTKRRKAASLTELKRFYDAAIDAASEVLSTTATSEDFIAMPDLRRLFTKAEMPSLSLTAALSSTGVEGPVAVAIEAAGGVDGSTGAAGGGYGSVCRRSPLFPSDVKQEVVETLTDSGEAFREALRKKLEATGGTQCKLGSIKKVKVGGAAAASADSTSSAPGESVTTCSAYRSGGVQNVSKILADAHRGNMAGGVRLLRRPFSAGSGDNGVRRAAPEFSSSSTTLKPRSQCGEEESKPGTNFPGKLLAPRTSYMRAPVPTLPGVKGSLPPANPLPPAPKKEKKSLRWSLSPKLLEALAFARAEAELLRGRPNLHTSHNSLGLRSYPPPPPRVALKNNAGKDSSLSQPAPKKNRSESEKGRKDGVVRGIPNKRCLDLDVGILGTTKRGDGNKPRRLCEEAAPLIPYWRRWKKNSDNCAAGGGRRVVFGPRARKNRPSVECVPIVRFGIMQQRQFNRFSRDEHPMSPKQSSRREASPKGPVAMPSCKN